MPKPVDVDAALDARDHPMRQQIDELRAVTSAVDADIREQWKWNAPSFRIRDDYLYTFMLRPDDHLHLVVHHPAAPVIASPLLEGEYADGRRMIYFRSPEEVAEKTPEFVRVLRLLVAATRAAIIAEISRAP